MPHEMTVVQQVRSHGAAIDRRAYLLASMFLRSFHVACPHLKTRLNADHERQCKIFAQRWAWFIRHLSHADQISPEFEAIGSFLAGRGMTSNDFSTARTCLLEALRHISRECDVAWGPQQESAWATTLDNCINAMSRPQPATYAHAA